MGYEKVNPAHKPFSFIIDFEGLGNDNLCTGITPEDPNGEFDCARFNTDEWAYSPFTNYTFQDPVPTGKRIIGVEVELFDLVCDEEANILINGAIIGVHISNESLCIESEPCGVSLTDMMDFPNGLPGYIYGGQNTFDLDVYTETQIGFLCTSHAGITFTYVDAIPTLSQWSLIILGLSLSIFGLVAVEQSIVSRTQKSMK